MAKVLQRHAGYCIVEGTPITTEATKDLLELIGPIRTTHYGGFYSFTADLASKDTAYTNIALPPHTDTTYFSEPAGLQMFHVLAHTSGSGGATILVDGCRAAQALYEQDRDCYRTLRETSISAHSSGNEDVSIQGEPFTVFSSSQVRRGGGMIKWNNDDRVAFDSTHLRQEGHVDAWYRAAA